MGGVKRARSGFQRQQEKESQELQGEVEKVEPTKEISNDVLGFENRKSPLETTTFIPKSGRIWKSEAQRQKASQQRREGTPQLRSSYVKRIQKKNELKLVKEREAEMVQAKKNKLEAARQATTDKKRRQQVNALKSATYSVVQNPSKVKAMSKKQLRSVHKMQVNDVTGEKELVPLYGTGRTQAARVKKSGRGKRA